MSGSLYDPKTAPDLTVGDIEIEWVMVADAVDIVNGKLYVLGGGWDSVRAESFPWTVPCGIAVSFSIPWGETNRRHTMEIEVRDDDGETAFKAGGYFEVGRPVGIKAGSRQRVQTAMSTMLEATKPGTFEIVVRVNDQELQQTTPPTFTILE